MKKIILIASTILFLSIVGWLLFINNAVPEIKPIYKQIEIKSKKNNESLFIRQKTWGMTSDNNIIAISNSSKNKFEMDSDYIYQGYSVFFYRHIEDSLFVYVSKKVEVPPKFFTKFKILQIQLSNTELMNLLANDAYKKKGISLF
jgi:hypothetical protein